MKAPDKIFIQRYSYGALLDGYSETPKEMAGGENIEFIRKDALLEWAKEQHKHFSEREQEEASAYGASPDAIFFSGKCDAFKSLISKLQEL